MASDIKWQVNRQMIELKNCEDRNSNIYYKLKRKGNCPWPGSSVG